MSKLAAALIVCIAALSLGGCADRRTESRPGSGTNTGSQQTSPDAGSSASDADQATALENCVTAVGADRKNCEAK